MGFRRPKGSCIIPSKARVIQTFQEKFCFVESCLYFSRKFFFVQDLVRNLARGWYGLTFIYDLKYVVVLCLQQLSYTQTLTDRCQQVLYYYQYHFPNYYFYLLCVRGSEYVLHRVQQKAMNFNQVWHTSCITLNDCTYGRFQHNCNNRMTWASSVKICWKRFCQEDSCKCRKVQLRFTYRIAFAWKIYCLGTLGEFFFATLFSNWKYCHAELHNFMGGCRAVLAVPHDHQLF